MKLKNKLAAHMKAFLLAKENGEVGDWSSWFLSMVVFPSLKDIANRIDDIEESRKKGKKRGGK